MTVHRAFLLWLEREFFVRKRQIASGHGAGRGADGGFQPMKTRQVGGMALVNPLKAWRLKGEVSASLSAPRLFGAVRKHGKIIEKGVFGVAEHNIGTILSPSTGTGIRISRNNQ